MKLLIVLTVALAYVSADVAHLKDESDATVLKSDFDITPEGAFAYAYETANGINAQATGSLAKSGNQEYPSLNIDGSYRYTAPDGTPVEVSYRADENGFNPAGSHLPVAPPIPEYILRSLQYIESHPAPVAAQAAKVASALFG